MFFLIDVSAPYEQIILYLYLILKTMEKYISLRWFGDVAEELTESLCSNVPDFADHWCEIKDILESYMPHDEETINELNKKLQRLIDTKN